MTVSKTTTRQTENLLLRYITRSRGASIADGLTGLAFATARKRGGGMRYQLGGSLEELELGIDEGVCVRRFEEL